MIKKTLVVIITFLTLSVYAQGIVFAAGEIHECDRTRPDCVSGLSCQPSQSDPQNTYLCQENIKGGRECKLTDVNGYPAPNGFCVNGYSCKPSKSDPSNTYLCQPNEAADIFGKIQPPDALKGFLQKDPTGASAISQFFSNFVALLFTVAVIVLIFMLLWGAFEWMISGGDKEKLAAAQRRLIHAFIGIILFAVAFAIIRALGVFTGFTFFKGQ